MFNGVPVEQYHQFISTPSSSSAPNSSSNLIQTQPPNLSNLNINNNFLSNFDHHHHHPILFPPHPSLHHHQTLLFQPNNNNNNNNNNQFLIRPPATQQPPADHHQYNINNNATTHHHHHDQESNKVDNDDDDEEIMDDIKEDDDSDDSWSNDEVTQLLKIKSSSQTSNWFTDHHFTLWDHVSRKLAEMGYKKSAEKCKDKFEEETCRSFGNTIGYNKDTGTSSRYLITEDLDEHLYNHGQNTQHPVPIHESPDHNVNINHQQVPRVDEKEGEDGYLEAQGQKGHLQEDPPTEITVESTQDDEQVTKSKKRKRKHKKFKMVKGLCVELVNRLMTQQEEMHRKLLQDMAIRDEEKIKREEAWRKEEMERVQREIQIREQEQEMARNRQSTITEFLNKITSFDQKIHIPCDINLQDLQNIATNIDRPVHLSGTTRTPYVEKFSGNRNQDHPTVKDDLGKRWPRDEVLALINIRSKVNSGNVGEEHHQGYTGNEKGGGSLWERISQGMLEVGYKRSAKRCKEKWENINKYFRKTKDANKKRSLDSRTCPYYHELNKLYNQEKKVAPSSNSGRVPSDEPENCLRPPLTPES